MLYRSGAIMHAMTDTFERAYRKSLSCEGLIYLGFEEHEIRVINLSLTGLLAEFDQNASVNDIKTIFNSIQASPRVDIYLPELRVAGEAEVVRAESTDEHLQIALEFRHLSYDIDHLLYRRRAYRKNMTAPGQLIINEFVYAFNTENVSVDGIMVRIDAELDVEPGTTIRFGFEELELQGEAQIIWTEKNPDSTLLGLKYLHLERDSIPGIPHFVKN